MNKLSLILVSTLGAALVVTACSGASVTEPAIEAGGQGGTAGSGATEPGGCQEETDCKGVGDCQTLQELKAECSVSTALKLYASSCGGFYVEDDPAGVTGSTWVFDANGEQIGGSYEDESSCSYWGSSCGPTGPGKPLCTQDCALYKTCDIGGANLGCPATLQDVPGYCDLGIQIQRQASGCGGTIVNLDKGIQHAIWTFDANDELVAVLSLVDKDDCDYWGTECDHWGTECDALPTGAPQAMCGMSGEGGVSGGGGSPDSGGASGTAGAGGSD